MKLQKNISLEVNKKCIGKTIPCIIEEIHSDGKIIARSYKDAPEVDGLVYIKNNSGNSKESKLNKFEKCKIIEISDYDLVAEFK